MTRLYRLLPADDLRTRAAKLTVNMERLAHGPRARRRRMSLRYERIMAAVAAHPRWHRDLLGWDICLSGTWTDKPEAVRERLVHAGRDHAAQESLADELSNNLSSLVYHAYTECGFDPFVHRCDHCWSYGVLTTDSEADQLCSVFYHQFADELRTRQLELTRSFIGYCFYDMLDGEAAQAYLEQRHVDRRGDNVHDQ